MKKLNNCGTKTVLNLGSVRCQVGTSTCSNDTCKTAPDGLLDHLVNLNLVMPAFLTKFPTDDSVKVMGLISGKGGIFFQTF